MHNLDRPNRCNSRFTIQTRKHSVISRWSHFPLFICLTLQACAFGAATPESQDPSSTRLLEEKVEARTPGVVILGDTQEHNLEGLPHGFITGVVDKVFADVTIRPPQHALFGRKLFETIAADAGGARPKIVHLGDLTDHSCELEMARMFGAVSRTKADVVIAPGNHDGLFQGIFNPPDITSHWGFSSLGWDYVCRHANEQNEISKDYPVQHPAALQVVGEPPVSNLLSKDRYVHAYLALLRKRGLIGEGRPCADASDLVCHEGNGFVKRIYSHIVSRQADCKWAPRCPKFTESFVVQELRLSDGIPSAPITLILLDTTQMDFLFIPSLEAVFGSKVNPGSRGYLRQSQLELVVKIAERARAEGEVLIFAGHHDWLHLEPETRVALEAIMERLPHPPVYLSGHTHRGFWAEHRLGTAKMIELNVSSLADWPIDARLVGFAVSKDRKAIEVTAGPVARGEARGDEELFAAWEESLCRHPQTLAVIKDPSKFIEDNRRVVRTHREMSGTWFSMLGAFLVRLVADNTDVERNFQYTDNLNDARRSLDAFAALLENSDTVDAWIQTLPFSIYVHSACTARPTLAEKLRCEVERSEVPRRRRAEGVRQTFVYLSSTLRDLQRVVDNASMQTTPGISRAMACAHLTAAHSDWQQGRERRYFLYDRFFRRSAVATKD